MVTNLISITNNFDQKTAEEFLEPVLDRIALAPIYQTLSGDDEEGIAIYTLVFKNLAQLFTIGSKVYDDFIVDLREIIDENFDDPFTNFSTILTDDHIIITIYTYI